MAYSVTYPSTVILALKDLINCSCCCHCAALTKVKRRPEVGLNMSCGCHLFLFIFPLSLSLSISVSVAEMLQASCPTVYLFNGSLQYVVKRLDWSWWMVTGCSGLVFSMRWTVGEMDSRLRTIWLEPFDGHTVHKTLHLHTAGMTLKKSVLQSRANVSPKMKNRAFAVNDTSVWNNAAYFPGFFSLWI